MQIVAALFTDEINLRQVAGPSTRIDLTGVQFSAVAPSPLPLEWAPHLVVIAGDKGERNLGLDPATWHRLADEVDFIVEREDGTVLAIEVKSASVIDKSAFKHIVWFRNNIVKKRDVIGIVLYTGEHVASFGDDLWAVPISSLWA